MIWSHRLTAGVGPEFALALRFGADFFELGLDNRSTLAYISSIGKATRKGRQ